jgi:HD-like signal output (HDOD) protein/GGDEF domain-containing protein
MDSATLERVLSCPAVPSLPTVAARVLELTSNQNVSMDDLAAEVELDQALSARILRTVNSSLYGLRQPCASIRKALVLLGLSPVKSLVLGFSLVKSVNSGAGVAFDWPGYWRRGLYAALAARRVAEGINPDAADEAFVAGLLQDVGMVAMHRALGTAYERVLSATGEKHSDLVRHELAAFETHHADIGAALCERWKLPRSLTLPVKHHERPAAAPGECAELIRAVALGRIMHDALTDADPTPAFRDLYARGRQWFNMTTRQLDDVLRVVGHDADEIAALFDLKTGAAADPDGALARANRQLLELAQDDPQGVAASERLGASVLGTSGRDPVTDAVGPDGFDAALRHAFAFASRGEIDLSVVHVLLDGARALASDAGELVHDSVVIGTVTLLRKHFEPAGGVVCRLTSNVLSVVLPGPNRHAVAATVDVFLDEFGPALSAWLPRGVEPATPVRVAAGVATIGRDNYTQVTRPEQLIVAASRAVQEAKAAGFGCARTASLGHGAAA